MQTSNNYLIALDVGERRVGVAIASTIAKLPRPLTVLSNDASIWEELQKLITTEGVGVVVVGLPRSLKGEDTAQTRYVRNFADDLAKKTGVKIFMQDEALTSRQAEAELRSRRGQFAKGDVDALAATYILEDYLGSIDSMELQS